MDATIPPNDRRTGAAWIAGTGAFLLIAAAGLFVAVQWRAIPDGVKLAMLAVATGGCCLGGRTLRRTLPATGDVVFHLGAFLLPVDLAAVCVHLQLGWRTLLLSEGILGVAGLGTLA